VIPSNLRKRYGLTEGTTVVFHEDRGRLVLAPSNHQAIYALQGSLAGFPLEQDLAEEVQRSRSERTNKPLLPDRGVPAGNDRPVPMLVSL
jgi:bifunctional DNA-binding transcriptional regulator/antitoxin component of YhaV-PrlF toxin-antitoxin module